MKGHVEIVNGWGVLVHHRNGVPSFFASQCGLPAMFRTRQWALEYATRYAAMRGTPRRRLKVVKVKATFEVEESR